MAGKRGKGKGRSGLSRTDWERQVAAYERSELTRQAFCAERGLSASTLDYWRRKLREEPPPASFIELAPLRADPDWDVELELGGGVVLRLRRR